MDKQTNKHSYNINITREEPVFILASPPPPPPPPVALSWSEDEKKDYEKNDEKNMEKKNSRNGGRGGGSNQCVHRKIGTQVHRLNHSAIRTCILLD